MWKMLLFLILYQYSPLDKSCLRINIFLFYTQNICRGLIGSVSWRCFQWARNKCFHRKLRKYQHFSVENKFSQVCKQVKEINKLYINRLFRLLLLWTHRVRRLSKINGQRKKGLYGAVQGDPCLHCLQMPSRCMKFIIQLISYP